MNEEAQFLEEFEEVKKDHENRTSKHNALAEELNKGFKAILYSIENNKDIQQGIQLMFSDTFNHTNRFEIFLAYKGSERNETIAILKKYNHRINEHSKTGISYYDCLVRVKKEMENDIHRYIKRKIDKGATKLDFFPGALDPPCTDIKYNQLNLIYDNICKAISVKDSLLKEKEKEKERKEKSKPEMLLDIWLPDRILRKEEPFNKYIDFLKQEYKSIGRPFVTDINGKLQWNKNPKKGWQQYMAGFIYTCIKKQWIPDTYSAPDFVRILQNTFNTKPNIRWFKSISIRPPKDLYLKPFSRLPANI